MAEQRSTPLEFDDFVSKVVPDPSQPPDAIVVSGFLGPAAKEGQIRVYADESLSSFVDVPADQVLHAQRLPADVSPLGGSVLWLRATAPVETPQAAPVAADFLRGPIQEQVAAGAAQAGLCAGGTLRPPLWTAQFSCPTRSPRCWTLKPPCRTRAPICLPPTVGFGCPNTVSCPPGTTQLGCPGTSTCPPPSESVPCQTWICGEPGPVIGTWACAAPQQGFRTAATICTQTPGCHWPTHAYGCPDTSTCPPGTVGGTRGIVCTAFRCPGPEAGAFDWTATDGWQC